MDRIDFRTKNDRELLVLIAQTVNNISEKLDEVNGCVRGHESRISVLESQIDKDFRPRVLAIESKLGEEKENKGQKEDDSLPNKIFSKFFYALLGIGVIIGGILAGLGSKLKWW